jgi:hypothetical protein
MRRLLVVHGVLGVPRLPWVRLLLLHWRWLLRSCACVELLLWRRQLLWRHVLRWLLLLHGCHHCCRLLLLLLGWWGRHKALGWWLLHWEATPSGEQ